jgi:hypothetical protein
MYRKLTQRLRQWDTDSVDPKRDGLKGFVVELVGPILELFQLTAGQGVLLGIPSSIAPDVGNCNIPDRAAIITMTWN